MFHRMARMAVSPIAALGFAVLLVLVALLSTSLASPGTAHADHNNRVHLQIDNIMPAVGEEGRSITVTLKLSRQLRDDEKYCYNANSPSDPNHRRDLVCVEGGVKIRDNYNDHLNEEGSNPYDNYIKFIFKGSQVEDRITFTMPDDECITPNRQLQIWIATEYQDRDEYPNERKHGYDIDTTDHYVRVIGNDDDDDPADLWPTFDPETHTRDSTQTCAPVESGAKEDGNYNRAPLFSDDDETLSVDENTAAGVAIGDPITAFDPDNTTENPNTDTLTYSLTGTDASHFDVDSSTGQIKTKGPLDHETKDIYHLAISVRDGKDIDGNSDSMDDHSIDVTINVEDINEPPQFDANAPSSLNVIENTAAGEDIGSPVTATDPDEGDSVSYSLDTGDGASFDVDDTTGQIQTKGALDRETKDTYTVTVTASDGELDGTHSVTIKVTEANDPPAYKDENGDLQTSTTREVAENTAAGQPVGDPVTATDEENDSLTYSLGGTDTASFDIESATGQIKTKSGVDLDYEGGTTSFSVTVSASDGKDAAGNTEDPPVEDASIDVTINVTDVNEGPAFADDAPMTLEVDENTAADTNIGSPFTATDPENDTPLTYGLTGTDAASFAIDTSTGQLKTKAALNHEDKDSYSVTITVRDSKNASGTADTATDDTHAVTITVTDVDDPGTITFSTDTPAAGTTLTATLADQDGVNSTPAVTWSWESSTDQSNWTSISDATTSSIVLDSDDVGNYYQVTANYDDEEGTGKSAQGETTNAVLSAPPTNKHPGFDDATTTRSVAENTPAGQNIGAPVSATHGDSKGTLVYSLDTTGATNFDIVSSTGQLKTKTVFDFETPPTSHTVTISVTDGIDDYENADTVVDGTIDVTITVTDVNEQPEFDTGLDTSLQVAENKAADTNIGSPFTATDPERDTLTYGLSGTDAASFSIDTATGQLKTKAALDFESGKTSYSISITVRDSKNASGAADTATDDNHAVTITVTDVDDPGTITFSTDTPAVGMTLAATLEDDDGVKASPAVTWSWKSSTDQSNWTTITGADTNSITLDADDIGNYYQVTAAYDDEKGSGKSAQGETTNAVVARPPTNVHPGFGDSVTTTRSIAENTPAGQNIGAPVSATHGDSKGTLVYSLDTTSETNFDIVSSTGQLKTSTVFDYETPPTSHTVTVSVTDGMDDYENADTVVDDTINVTITVTDVNEGPAFADDAPATREVAENSAAGTNIGSPYTATDPEGDTPLTYSLAGTDGASFAIDTATGQLKTKADLDHESKDSYSVTVQVTDGKAADGTSETNATIDDTHAVTITVTDVDEDGTLTLSSEHPRIGAPLTATLSDEDADVANQAWEWETSDNGNDPWTTITGETGVSYTPVSGDLDKYLRVTVTYDDTHGTGKEITEQADNAVVENTAPDFGATTATRSVPENTPSGQNIGAPVTATDSDTDDMLTYSLSGTNASSFSIVSSSGQLQTKAPLDYETKNSYSVIVTATDTAGATDAITVTINVTNVSEGNERTRGNGGNGGGNGGNSGGNGGNSGGNGGNNNNVVNNYVPYIPPPQNTKSNTNDNGPTIKAVTPPANRAPVFSDGASTERSVPERSVSGTDIGAPVAATDADNDLLTYTLDGTDAASFSIDTGTGQLRTLAALDYEVRNRYSVNLSVSDGRGGTDTIAVTIRITDATDVPVVNRRTQVVAVIYPGEEHEVTTPDGSVTATFPAGTRSSPYIVSLDSRLEGCDWSALETPPAENLHACLTLVVYDTQGNVIGGSNILNPAFTIEFTISAEEVGDNDIAAFTESDGAWSSVSITTSTDEGYIIVTISGVAGPGTWAVGSNAPQVVTQVVAPPTVQPTQEVTTRSVEPVIPVPEPKPAEQNTPIPTPTPTAQPTETPAPTAVPTPTPTLIVLEQSAMVAPPRIDDLGNASQLNIPQVTFQREGPLGSLRVWPIILLALGIAMELVSLGLFLKEREADKRRF